MSAALAGVSSAASGIQTAATVTTRWSFQPSTQPCQPDLVQPASVSIEVCGTTPASRCFLCQTPPLACSAVLSIATACPPVAQGSSSPTRYRPGQPTREAAVLGQAPSQEFHLPGRLLQDRQQPADRRDVADQHDHQRLQEEPLRVDRWTPSPRPTSRLRWAWNGVNHVDQRDQQRRLRYHRSAYPVWCDDPMVGATGPAGLLSGGACDL